MAKAKAPLLSLGARGGLGDVLSFARRMKLNIVEKKPIPDDAKSPAQLAWRHMFNKVVTLWHGLSAAEKQAWESLARPFHMTGYAYFISQSLRPNPGIYLPLQGGTMAGDIDMAKFRILKLPAPVDGQEPVNRTYYWANLPVGGYTEGARVYKSAGQSIPNTTSTIVSFNSEDYDTDTIHDNVTNNSRLTCKTAGKYIVFAGGRWASHNTGLREFHLLKNGAYAAYIIVATVPGSSMYMEITVILNLAVNDYMELRVYQNSGGALGFGGATIYQSQFSMQRIG